jgi:hypothetical protein
LQATLYSSIAMGSLGGVKSSGAHRGIAASFEAVTANQGVQVRRPLFGGRQVAVSMVRLRDLLVCPSYSIVLYLGCIAVSHDFPPLTLY